MPERIQRRRTKGWRMPEGAIYVGRPTIWGNPHRVGGTYDSKVMVTAEDTVHAYRSDALWPFHENRDFYSALRGRDLVCWCPLDQPCHADVLLELANA